MLLFQWTETGESGVPGVNAAGHVEEENMQGLESAITRNLPMGEDIAKDPSDKENGFVIITNVQVITDIMLSTIFLSPLENCCN